MTDEVEQKQGSGDKQAQDLTPGSKKQSDAGGEESTASETEQVDETSSEPVSDDDLPEELPEDESEQAGAFQGMRHKLSEKDEQIQQLQQELEARKRSNTMFDELDSDVDQGQGFSGQQTKKSDLGQQFKKDVADQGVDLGKYVDQNGYVDIRGLEGELNKVLSEAKKASQQALKNNRETERQRKQREAQEAFEAYPELNPKGNDFDRDFHNKVRAVITDSMLYPDEYGGKPLSYKAAADKVVGASKEQIEKARAQGAQRKSENTRKKEQATAEAETNQRPAERNAQEQAERERRLKERSRGGPIRSREAIAERLSRSG